MKIYFHGCWAAAGHYTWLPSGRMVDREEEHEVPWKGYHLLCPGARPGYGTPRDVEIEGHAALHHAGGWTALAWWDRSVDHRYGCQAVLLAQGTWTGEEMLSLGRDHYGAIMSRFAYPIRVVSRPTELTGRVVVCSTCGAEGRGSQLPRGWTALPPGWFTSGTLLACSPGCAQ